MMIPEELEFERLYAKLNKANFDEGWAFAMALAFPDSQEAKKERESAVIATHNASRAFRDYLEATND